MATILQVPWRLPLGDGWKVVYQREDGMRIRLWQTYDERLAQGVCLFLLDLGHLPQTEDVLQYLTALCQHPPCEKPEDAYTMGMEDEV